MKIPKAIGGPELAKDQPVTIYAKPPDAGPFGTHFSMKEFTETFYHPKHPLVASLIRRKWKFWDYIMSDGKSFPKSNGIYAGYGPGTIAGFAWVL